MAKRPYVVDDEGITFEALGKSVRIAKGEVTKVYDVIEKPLTDAGEYAAGELGPLILFDPYFYVYGFHLEKYVEVQLYDAEAVQDDSSARCAPRARNLK